MISEQTGTYNFYINQGASYERTFLWTTTACCGVGSAPGPVDLTGYYATLQFRQYATSPVILYDCTNDLILGGVAGTIALNIPPAATMTFTFWNAVYDLLLTDSSGNATRLLTGTVTISPQVSVFGTTGPSGPTGSVIPFIGPTGPTGFGPTGPTGPPGSVGVSSVTATVATSVNNFAPSGYVPGQTTRLILTPASGGATITGLLAAPDGWEVDIINASTTDYLEFSNQSSSSLTANQFVCPGGNPTIVGTSAAAIIKYVVSQWRFMS